MIGYINGEVVNRAESKVLIKTNSGIGYEVYYVGNQDNTSCSLYLTQIFREKSQELYGFDSYNEKVNFELLLSVNGVGPKSAYSLIKTLGAPNLFRAIEMEDVKSIKKAPGIGPKAAKQIILDLKGKVQFENTLTQDDMKLDQSESFTIYQETICALKELGFDEQKVSKDVKEKLKLQEYKNSEELIKTILQQLN